MIVALINGGNDLIATHFDLSINQIMWGTRIGIFVLPPLAFVITKRLCLSLQRADRELVLHGRETGRLLRLPSGEFVEVHEPISPEKAYLLTSHEQLPALDLPTEDARGVKRAGAIRNKIRSRMSVAHSEAVPKVSTEDLKEIENH
jgi:ubiquinol-cytochrome c reductase cytochrome b subunit